MFRGVDLVSCGTGRAYEKERGKATNVDRNLPVLPIDLLSEVPSLDLDACHLLLEGLSGGVGKLLRQVFLAEWKD
jgi:hypothetical protein